MTALDIIGVPFDLSGLRPGSRLGPAAIRLAGLIPALERLGLNVRDRGDVAVGGAGTLNGGLRDFAGMLETSRNLRAAVEASRAEGRVPVVLGGDHTVGAGSVAGGLIESGALLWIDAHADVNTPGTSESGNLHGMPVAALWGLDSGVEWVVDEQWRSWLAALSPTPVTAEKTSWLGLRDVDSAERPRVRHGRAFSMQDVDRYGLPTVVEHWREWLIGTGAPEVWISFDVDALDPVLAPGTGTAVRGGLTYREAHLLAELLHEALSQTHVTLAGVDVVETNPLVDRHNETAVMAVEWLSSLMGKTVLGGGR